MYTQVSCHPTIPDVSVTVRPDLERVLVTFGRYDNAVTLYHDTLDAAIELFAHVLNRLQAERIPPSAGLSFPAAVEFAARVEQAVADRSER